MARFKEFKWAIYTLQMGQMDIINGLFAKTRRSRLSSMRTANESPSNAF